MSSHGTTSRIMAVLLAGAGLVVLGVQVARFYFATDDAFISFRYARNLVEGHGLVFNVGERVEGYSNFLWTLWSAVGHALGAAPVAWANVSSIVLTVVLLGLIVMAVFQRLKTADAWLAAAMAVVFLAVNRSFAVWATGGLETRLFTVLVFAAVVTSPLFTQNRSRLWMSSGLFALAALTRMEAYLLFGVVTLLVLGWRREVWRWRGAEYLNWFGPFGVVAIAHLIFRMLYYGYPLPNTAYAKITGANFDMGWRYLEAFVMEYHLWLLAPLILAAALVQGREAKLNRQIRPVALSLVMFVPYVFYLAYIGGDHFEYRQLDVLLPFLAMAIGAGVAALVGRSHVEAVRVGVAVVLLAVIVAATGLIPWLGEKGMPDRYQVASVPAVAVEKYPLLRLIPGYAAYIRSYNDTYKELVRHLAAVRAEEHRFFLARVTEQAGLLNRYLEEGLIGREASLSLICIGAIPYYTGLTTIDYNGLTDEHVAHSEATIERTFGRRLIAHEKNADWAYLRERGVDYVFSIGWGFFSDSYPISITQPQTYLVQLPERWFAFRTTMSEEEVRSRFGAYPIIYRAANDLVQRLN